MATLRATVFRRPSPSANEQKPAWFIDPQNVTGVASNGNDGVTATSPLRTYTELWGNRWQTWSPRLRQSTTITFLSSHTDNTDPVYFTPTIENGAVVLIQGALGAAQQISSGVLSNVTAKNRAAGQLLLAQSGATSSKQLVVNSTHPSRAWTYALSAGSIYRMTQPLAPVVIPSVPNPAEVDTWANGDAVVVYQPVQINLIRVGGIFGDFNAGFSNSWVWLSQLTVFGAGGFDGCAADAVSSQFIDCSFNGRTLNLLPMLSGSPIRNPRNCNAFFQRVAGGGSITTNFQGGAITGSSFLSNACLDQDLILAGSTICEANGGGFAGAGTVYIESGQQLISDYSNFNMQTLALSAAFAAWGTGGINMRGTARLIYPPGAGKAVATFMQTGGFLLNGQTGCVLAAPNAAPTAGKTLSATALDADLGATTAAYYVPGGACITNESL